MKYLVYGIYILEVVQSALITKIGFWTFVTNLGDVQVFDRAKLTWLIPTTTAIGELFHTEHEWPTSEIPPGTFFVQGFYAHRIHILAQSKKLAGAIIAVSFRKRSTIFKT